MREQVYNGMFLKKYNVRFMKKSKKAVFWDKNHSCVKNRVFNKKQNPESLKGIKCINMF